MDGFYNAGFVEANQRTPRSLPGFRAVDRHAAAFRLGARRPYVLHCPEFPAFRTAGLQETRQELA